MKEVTRQAKEKVRSFLRGASFGSAACQHFGFLINDRNEKAADKM